MGRLLISGLFGIIWNFGAALNICERIYIYTPRRIYGPALPGIEAEAEIKEDTTRRMALEAILEIVKYPLDTCRAYRYHY